MTGEQGERDGVRRGLRRCARREVALECAARSERWDGELRLRIADLSESGLWVETFRPLDVGQELIVSFTPPLAPAPVWVAAQVVRTGVRRVAETAPPKRGFGLAIRHCSAWHRRLLVQCLRRVPPRLPAQNSPREE